MASRKRKQGFSTKALHGGYEPSEKDASIAVPLYQSVAYHFGSTETAAALFEGEGEGFIYSRINNPTVDVFEKRMADLECAEAGLATASGMSAIFLVAVYLAGNGQEIVSSNRLYGGTFHLFSDTLPKLGINTRFVETPHDLRSWEDAISEKTRFFFLETPSNPKAEVFEIRALAELAHKYDLPLVVDSTIATPALQQPILHKADLVIHSATKYICGTGTALGGIVVGERQLLDDIRLSSYRDIGPALAPFHAWLFILGLETLSLRMKQYSNNACQIAEILEEHPRVSSVHYPGLASSAYRKLVSKQMRGFASSLLAFEIEGTREDGGKFIDSLKLVSHGANLGDNKTLVLHPASTTHNQILSDDLTRAGISDTMIRMSIGLEDPSDIIDDIRQALKRI